MFITRPRHLRLLSIFAISSFAFALVAACGGDDPAEVVRETVIVERPVEQTVVVERPVEQTVVVPQTVVVRETAVPVPTQGVEKPKPTGNVVVAEDNVIAPIFVHNRAGQGLESKYFGWGIVEALVHINDAGEFDPSVSLATKWDVASDNSKVTFELRRGVKFHGDWGEMTADDVVWSNNNATQEGSSFYGFGPSRYMDRWEKIDDYTVEMHFDPEVIEPKWLERLSIIQTHQPWIGSKKVIDDLGEDRAVTTAIGTGSYQVRDYVSGEKVELQAFEDHWKWSPKVKDLTVVEIKEPLALQAAFRVGEVDIALITNSLVFDTLSRVPGSTFKPVGAARGQMIFFTGNYWLQKHPTTGEQVFPRPGFKPDDSHPWIGNPYENGDVFDGNTPSMQRALKVRKAMAMAVDKVAIQKTIFGGFGVPGGTYNGFTPDHPLWKSEWEVPSDLNGAKTLLNEAGFPNGFPVTFYVPPDHIVTNPEMGPPVAQNWQQLGLDVSIDSAAYAAARPRHFDGQDDIIWYRGAALTSDLDGAKSGNCGPRNTFDGCELPDDIIGLFFENQNEPDQQKRLANNVALQDFVSDWMLNFSVATFAQHFVIRPEIIAWEPHPYPAAFFVAPWTLEVRR